MICYWRLRALHHMPAHLRIRTPNAKQRTLLLQCEDGTQCYVEIDKEVHGNPGKHWFYRLKPPPESEDKTTHIFKVATHDQGLMREISVVRTLARLVRDGNTALQDACVIPDKLPEHGWQLPRFVGSMLYGSDLFEHVCDASNLGRDGMPPFSRHETKTIVTSLLEAVSVLHRVTLAHGDIKLENIVMLKPCQGVRLIDFECSSDLLQAVPAQTDTGGTKIHYPPELWLASPEQAYSRHANRSKVDSWCVAQVIYTLLCCRGLPAGPEALVGTYSLWGCTVHVQSPNIGYSDKTAECENGRQALMEVPDVCHHLAKRALRKAQGKADSWQGCHASDVDVVTYLRLMGSLMHPDPECRVSCQDASSHLRASLAPETDAVM